MSLASSFQIFRSSALRQFMLFAAVGGIATITHAATAFAAHQYLDHPPLLANLLGYAFAFLVSYYGNSKMTFKTRIMNGGQFSRFMAASLVVLALNQATVFLFVTILKAPFTLALIPVVILVPIFSFAASKFWAFSAPRPKALKDRN